VPIPDNDPNGVTDVISVPDSGNIADVNVQVSIFHTFIGDLTIDIEHAGITVRLWDRQCDTNEDLDVIFDDEGDPVVCATPTVGRFQPVQSLDAYDHGDLQGDWTLTVADNAPQDIGTLVAWGISGTLRGFDCCVAVQVGNNPPDGAIDAREEHQASQPGNLTGLRAFVATFDDNTSVVRQCFSVAETGGGDPPVVVRVDRLQNNEVRVNFDRPITVQEWTTLAYNGVGGTTLTDVGFLPADVNQSRQSTGRDISELIDCLNDVIVCADYQTDINRSGNPNGNDITSEINLLQQSSEYPRGWLNETIVEEPNP
jgi:subtilisin-like proprotein convertase family protein